VRYQYHLIVSSGIKLTRRALVGVVLYWSRPSCTTHTRIQPDTNRKYHSIHVIASHWMEGASSFPGCFLFHQFGSLNKSSDSTVWEGAVASHVQSSRTDSQPLACGGYLFPFPLLFRSASQNAPPFTRPCSGSIEFASFRRRRVSQVHGRFRESLSKPRNGVD
jgi:hypothetical protein